MKICIDPGHGGKTTGAVGSRGIPEKNIVPGIARKLGEHLEQHGIEVIYTREADVYVSLPERCNIANKSGCDYFVSIHLDGFKDTAAHGTSTYCFAKGKTGESMAMKVQEEMIKVNGRRNRGVKYCGNNLYVVSKTNMPAILIECAFLTNSDDEAAILDPAWQDAVTSAIAKGILREVGIPWQDEKPQENTDDKDAVIKELQDGNTQLRNQLDGVIKNRDELIQKINKIREVLN